MSLLSLGSNAISASNSGVAVATNNVANANTAGYSREVLELDALQPSPLVGGVKAGATTRTADDLLSARIRSSAGNLASMQTQSDGLSDLEQTLSASPLSDQMSTLFSALNQVAASPNDKTSRDAVVSALQSTVTSIHSAASAVATAQTDADQQVGTLAAQANSLAQQLARANTAAQNGDPTALDQRDQLATQLSKLVGGQATTDSSGQMRFVLDGGAVLVDGQTASTMSTKTDAATGLTDVLVSTGTGQRDVTSQIGGGQLGGALSVRAQTVAIAGQYDQLAFDLASHMNSIASANAAPDGTTGHDIFTAPTGVAGAAASLEVDPALAASSDNLATASPGTGPGDSGGALALYGLSTSTVASGGTRSLSDASLDILAGLGETTANAKASAQTDQTVDSHLSDLRDSVSGVDVNEEQANLSRFESSVTALTRFVSTIDTMMTNLVENL
nr:flagellar hook-associated protein FlgK [Kofleriaceae bacterium]